MRIIDLVFHILNFNNGEFDSINEEKIKKNIQMEYMRIDHLNTIKSKVVIYINSEQSCETKLITYHQQTAEKQLVAIDPNYHFDLIYNELYKQSSEADLKLLNSFIEQFLHEKINSSSSAKEKEQYIDHIQL